MMPSSAEALVVVASISRSPCSTPMRDRHGLVVVGDEQDQGQEELVPGPDEEEVNSTASVGRVIGTTIRHRTCQPGRAVDPRGLEDLDRERPVAPS